MSFLGIIRKVMECSGISQLFHVVHISDTAIHMLSGKVIQEYYELISLYNLHWKLDYTSIFFTFNHLSASFTKWLNTLKLFVGKLPTNGLSVFDNSVKLVLNGLSLTEQLPTYDVDRKYLFYTG